MEFLYNAKPMIDYMSQLGLIGLSTPNIGFEQLANQLNTTANEADKVEDVTKTFDELNEKIDKIQNAFSTATSAIQEYNEKSYLSIDNLQSLLALDGKYLNVFSQSLIPLLIQRKGHEIKDTTPKLKQ